MHVESAHCTKISIYLANFHALSLPALLSRSEVLLSPLRASEPGINAWSLRIAAASFYFAFFSWIVALNLECRLLRLEMVLAPTEEGQHPHANKRTSPFFSCKWLAVTQFSAVLKDSLVCATVAMVPREAVSK